MSLIALRSSVEIYHQFRDYARRHLARPAPLRLVSCGRDTPTRGEPKRVRWALYTQRAAGHLSEGE
ncbi:hypothetical protein J6590_049765 [Homalodisca vitripennis]|nr:hypothetical protein J6590_049765 [Homalodisca vitripennis]